MRAPVVALFYSNRRDDHDHEVLPVLVPIGA
jgi:hypothetical protein